MATPKKDTSGGGARVFLEGTCIAIASAVGAGTAHLYAPPSKRHAVALGAGLGALSGLGAVLFARLAAVDLLKPAGEAQRARLLP